MTASRIPTRRTSFTSPVVDYEPAPVGAPSPAACPSPPPAALHRHSPRSLRPVPAAPLPAPEPPLPRAAVVFADNALRRVLEVADRRRPAAQLRPLLVPSLFEPVTTVINAAATQQGSAILRRVRLQPSTIVDGEATAAEVFASYSRGPRVRAIAGRVELVRGRWVIVALQIG